MAGHIDEWELPWGKSEPEWAGTETMSLRYGGVTDILYPTQSIIKHKTNNIKSWSGPIQSKSSQYTDKRGHHLDLTWTRYLE